MTTIGLIGAGHIGSQVARLAVANGYDVVISNSRGPETLSALVAELGPKARAAAAVDAARAGDIVVVTIPLKNYRSVPVEPLSGKIVIDTNNYYPARDGHIPSSTRVDDRVGAFWELTCRPRGRQGLNHIYSAELTTHGQPASKIGAPRHRRRRPRSQGDGHPSPRSVWFRNRGRGPTEGRWRIQARYSGYGPRRTTEDRALAAAKRYRNR
jgi:hypothetical protein